MRVVEGVKENKLDIVWWLKDFFGLFLLYDVFVLSCFNFSISRTLLVLFTEYCVRIDNCLW